MENSTQQHWDNVYATKDPDQVSWTQNIPTTSLEFIHSFPLDKNARIIDIGGGDSRLVDHLLAEGYTNLTVLDISAKALEKARVRLGKLAEKVNWIVSDATLFEPTTTYDVWHDRATFHFLTTAEQISAYLRIARKAVQGFMTIGTFSDQGPTKCSGLTIRQYNEVTLTEALDDGFRKIRCLTEDHITPFQTQQNFLFCSFKRVV